MYKLKHFLLIIFTITLVNSHISIADEFETKHALSVFENIKYNKNILLSLLIKKLKTIVSVTIGQLNLIIWI